MIKASRGSPCSKEMFTSDIEQLFLSRDSGRNRSSLSSSIIGFLLLACVIPLAVQGTLDTPSTAVNRHSATLADCFAAPARFVSIPNSMLFTTHVIVIVSLAQLMITAVIIEFTFLTALFALPFFARLLSLISKTLFHGSFPISLGYNISTAVSVRFATLTS